MSRVRSILFIISMFCFSSVFSQLVTGKITDAEGRAINAASINEVGTSNGAYTGFNGVFKIKSPQNGAKIKVSCIGYETQEIPYTGGPINVQLKQSVNKKSEIQIVGTRNKNRTVLESAVPVDVISMNRASATTGSVDVNQILQYTAPSFNTNKQSGSDGADHIMPATLRGMGPDQTLVLLNGKRYHQSALVNLYGTRGRGNTGTDLNTIPSTSIDRIEILRDGASAQYGSDAIAGVMNVILKQNTGQLTGNVSVGANITGYGGSLNNAAAGKLISNHFDGEQVSLGLNYGIALKKGFLNLTGEGMFKNKTFRPNNAKAYTDNYRDKSGDASNGNMSFFANYQQSISDKIDLYGNLGVGYRLGSSYAWTRTADDDRNIPSIYPNGFNPDIQSKILDIQSTVGAKIDLGEWNWDLYGNFGKNRFDYDVDKTLNASLGTSTPTMFYAGGFSLEQYLAGTSISRHFDHILSGFNFASGVEYRIENYKLFQGNTTSWKQYPDALGNYSAPGGSQGFPGFQPKDETDQNRSNIGGYVDAELDVTKKWMVNGAVRLENYSDFGFTPNVKLASRYKVTDDVILRGAISTGFRAPSLAQMYFSSTFTNVVAGAILDQTLAPNNSVLANAMGIPKLKQETSLNGSFGVALKPHKNLSLTIDGYYVKVNDRIVLTGTFGTDISQIASILNANNVSGVQFFTNAVNTTTYGLDIVANATNLDIFDGKLNLTFAANFNKMNIDKIFTNNTLTGLEDVYFGPREQAFLLASAPTSKISLNFDQRWNKFAMNLRFTHFAAVKLVNWNQETDYYKERLITDLSFSYNFNKNILITLGCNNLFDVYPTSQNPGLTEGGAMWDAVQNGYSGAFYYSKIGFKF